MLAIKKPTLPTTMTLRPAPERLLIIDRDGGVHCGMIGVLRRRDEVGSRADSLLHLRIRALHDHRVQADAGHHREMIRRLIINLDSHQVNRLVDAIEGNAEGRHLVQRDADVAGQQIPGAGRDQAERDAGVGQSGADHPDRAVAAGA